MGNRKAPTAPPITPEASSMNVPFAAAFTEWDRRYREDPAEFMSAVEHLLGHTAATYGEACSAYFVKVLTDLAGAGNPWNVIGR